MNVTPDTNVLLRAVLDDDPAQARIARETLDNAKRIAISAPSLCEFVWVLRHGRKRGAGEVASAIRRLVASGKIEVDRPVIEAGLAILEAGGDFADGVIAQDGRRAGGDVFVSFDGDAVNKLRHAGYRARNLSKE